MKKSQTDNPTSAIIPIVPESAREVCGAVKKLVHAIRIEVALEDGGGGFVGENLDFFRVETWTTPFVLVGIGSRPHAANQNLQFTINP